jgi:tetratricopeptide (TPR) repeat protein
MTQKQIEFLIKSYEEKLKILEKDPCDFSSDDVLNVLVARDKIQKKFEDETMTSEFILKTTQLDDNLKKITDKILIKIDLTEIRGSFIPDKNAWWWYLDYPILTTDKFLPWIKFIIIILLAVSLALLSDITNRLLSGGSDLSDTLIVMINALLALSVLGSVLTKTGRELFDKLFSKFLISIKIPHQDWNKYYLLFFIIIFSFIVFERFVIIPQRSIYYSSHGVWLQNDQQDLLGAKRDFIHAINLNPNNYNAHYNLGHLYEELNEYTSARSEYVIALASNNPAVYNNLARLDILDEHYESAVSRALTGLKLNPTDDQKYDLLKNLGWAKINQEFYYEAIKFLSEAIDLNTNYAPAHCLLAEAQDKLGKTNDALSEWGICRKNIEDPEKENYWFSLANQRLDDPFVDCDLCFNLLINVEGEVLFFRTNWSNTSQATMGTLVNPGDEISLRKNMRIDVLCENFKLITIAPPTDKLISFSYYGCPGSGRSPAIDDGRSWNSTRTTIDKTIPFIISPRATSLLSDLPFIRWNAVDGVKSYRVQIRGENFDWETTINDTQLQFPDNPKLIRGNSYFITVIADNGSSSFLEGKSELGFEILGEVEANQVRQKVSRLQALNLPTEAESLAMAQFYLRNNLYSEAIDILNQIIKNGTNNPAIYQLQGDLLNRVGLSFCLELKMCAADQYLLSYDLLNKNDIANKAQIEFNLGLIYSNSNLGDTAIGWLKKAADNFKSLGDTQKVNEISEAINAIK